LNHEKDNHVRWHIVDALKHFDFMCGLKGKEPPVWHLAKVRNHLFHHVRSKHQPLREQAIHALVDGLRDEGALPLLAQAAKDDPESEVRIAAISAISAFGPKAKYAIPMLRSIVEKAGDKIPSDAPALTAFRVLIELGPLSIPTFLDQLRSPVPATRAIGADGLCALGKEAKVALPALVRALDDPESEVRELAAQALGKMGPLNREQIRKLRLRLMDSSETVRKATREALKRLGEKPASVR
jgi:HEAT repeat protein